MTKDFTPVKGQITLHGLGFLQVKLPNNQRIHVWHPDLPKRKCAEFSPFHNHRFAFRSQVLVGTQINQRGKLWTRGIGQGPRGSQYVEVVSHDGPRRPTGSRESYVSGKAVLEVFAREYYGPGESYEMPIGQYHRTVTHKDSPVVVTLMTKLSESTIHAKSLIKPGETFDQEFDRFQLSEDEMWDIFLTSLKGAA